MNLELDINKYTVDELETNVFSCISNNYTEKEIIEKEQRMLYDIQNNKNIDEFQKSAMNNFIHSAKNILLNKLSSSNNTNSILNSNSNSMSILTKKYTEILNINSLNRQNSYSSSKFQYILDVPIKNVTSIQVMDINIPKSYYNISTELYNNTLSVILEDGRAFHLSIPSANYTITTLIQTLNNIIQSADTSFNHITFMYNNMETVDEFFKPGKLVIKSSTETPFSLNFSRPECGGYNLPHYSKLGWILGFREREYISNGRHMYQSEGLVDVNIPKYIYLVIDDNTSANNFNSSIMNIGNKNIINGFSTHNTHNTSIIDDKLLVNTIPRKYDQSVSIKSLYIELVDEYGRVINLNNMDFTFNLVVELEY